MAGRAVILAGEAAAVLLEAVPPRLMGAELAEREAMAS